MNRLTPPILVPHRAALLSSVAGAVLLGLGAPAMAASAPSAGSCSSTNGTISNDRTNGDLCLSPDGNAATATHGYAVAIGSGSQATTSTTNQGVIDYRTSPNGNITVPNSNPGDADYVSGTAIGQDTVVGAGGGVGIGYNNAAGTGAGGFMGVAIGANNAATGNYGTAIGQANVASGRATVGLGVANQATGDFAVAIGRQNYAVGNTSIAQGFVSSAYGASSIALGNAATAGVSGQTTTVINDVAIGNAAKATGGSGVALGDGAATNGAGSIAIGQGTTAATSTSNDTVADFRNPGNNKQINNLPAGTTTFTPTGVAIGALSTVGNTGGVALGYNNNAGNTNGSNPSFAIGANNLATGINAVALGLNNTASNAGTVAIGTDSQATGQRTIAIGRESYAVGDYSMAQGYVASAYGSNAIALGNTAVAGVSGQATTVVNDVAIGNGAQATGGSSVALGDGASASGGKAVSIGYQNTAIGDGAVAIGDPSTASGTGAFAGGADNAVYGEGAAGIGNANTVNSAGAPANGTVALGDQNTAAGQGSVALGFRSTATGAGSLAFGDSASATNPGGVALGSGAVDGAANRTNGTYTLPTTGPISLGYDNAQGVNTGTVSVGSGSSYRQVQNVADGSGAHDAVNVEQLASVASQANGAIAPLQAASKLAVQYTPDANGNPTAAVDLTKGGALGAVSLTGLAPATASTGAVALGQMPLQYSNGSGTATPGTASNDATLVGAQPGTVTLHNLGPGSLASTSTDAVNGAQLYAAGNAAAANFGGTAAYNTATGQISAPGYAIRGTTYHNVGDAFGAVDNSLGALQAASGDFSSDNTSAGANALSSGKDASAGGYGSAATGAGSAVLGNGAADNGNAGSTVLGMKASIAANTPGSNVALGQGSVASSGAASSYGAFGLTPAQTAIGEVSVGSSNGQRRITNVAAGRDANDAVDVAQLQGAASNLGASTAAALGGGSKYDGTTGTVSAPSYTIRGTRYADAGSAFTAVDDSLGALQGSAGAFSSDNTANQPHAAAAGQNATAGGFGAVASGAGSAVLGNSATDNGVANSTVLGMRASIATGTTGSNVALGQGSVASSGAATNYAAFGLSQPQNAVGEVSLGSAGAARRITNLAAGRDAGDAVNVAQLRGAVDAAPLQYSTAANPTTANPGVASNDVTLVGAGTGPVSLHNLAAGKLGATSTDAVNGAQLYAGGTSIASAFGGGAAYDTATGALKAPRYTIAGQSYDSVGGALGALDGSVNGGGGVKYFHANSTLADSSATGQDALAAGGAAVASGASATAVGANASSTGRNSVALGAGSTDGGQDNVVSVGAAGAERRIVNVAAGTLAQGSTDAANAGQVFAGGSSIASILGGGAAYDPATGKVLSPTYAVNGTDYSTVGGAVAALDRSVSGGAGIKYFHSNSTLGDAAASGTDAVAAGPLAQASGTGAVAIGVGAIGSGAGSVAIGAGSTDGGQDNVVSVGAVGAERRIVNVAAGMLAEGSTDAANAGQVFAGGSSIASILGGGAAYDPATGKVTAPTYAVNGTGYSTVGGAVAALDRSVSGGAGIKYFHSNSTLGDAAASGTDAVAAGPLAQASGTGAVAIGKGATSSGAGSVAIGAGSTDDGQDNVVSVGAVGAERRIVNVAAGTLAQGSTDAATAGQVYAAGSSVASILGGGAAYDTSSGKVTAPSYAIGGSSYGTVGGALAALDGSVNGGAGIKYFHANSTLADSSATGTDAVAMGPAATASGTSGVAIGSGATSSGRNSVALGAGSTDGGQDDVVSVGSVGAERRITNVAAGTLGEGSTDAVNGGQLYQTNRQVAALGHAAVQYDVGADGRTLSSVSLGADAGGPVVIHNLGAGTAATDAANVGQLRAATANAIQYDTSGGVRSNTVTFAGGQPGTVALQNVGPGVNGTDAVNVNQLNAAAGAALGQAQGYTDARINNLAALTQQAIGQARSDAAAGTASALAASGLRYDDRPGKTTVAGAASYYKDQAGLAFGLGHTAEDGHVRLNAAVTVSPTMAKPEVGAVVGGSWSFN